MAASPAHKFVGLPLSVAQPVDVGRLIREVGQIDELLHQASIRSPETAQPVLRLSANLAELVKLNSVDITQAQQRTELVNFLEAIKSRAPVIHISFGAEPSTDFLDKLIAYLRKDMSPLTLIIVGLEPNIGIGCVVRTNNKYFDLSLKKRLAANRNLLIQKIKDEPVKPEPTLASPA